MGSTPKIPKAKEADYGADIGKFVSGLEKAFPSVLGLEQQYREKFQGLNLGDISSLLSGTGGQGGVTDIGGRLSQTAGQQLGDARGFDLRQMTGQAGMTRGLMQGLSPESAAAVQQASQAAATANANAQGLTPGETRSAQQFAREGAASRGRTFDNTGIAAEVLNRDNILGQKRAEAATATGNAFNLANSFYTAPGLQALSSTPQSFQAGQNYLNIGLGGVGSAKPQLVDIGAGLNLGAADRQNELQRQSANAQLKAQNTQMWAGLLGKAAETGGQAAGAVAMMSDKRLKKDIKKLGKTNGGLPIYTYKMKGEDKTQMGVMAQEVQKKQPKAAVDMPNGFLGVRYDQIK